MRRQYMKKRRRSIIKRSIIRKSIIKSIRSTKNIIIKRKKKEINLHPLHLLLLHLLHHLVPIKNITISLRSKRSPE